MKGLWALNPTGYKDLRWRGSASSMSASTWEYVMEIDTRCPTDFVLIPSLKISHKTLKRHQTQRRRTSVNITQVYDEELQTQLRTINSTLALIDRNAIECLNESYPELAATKVGGVRLESFRSEGTPSQKHSADSYEYPELESSDDEKETRRSCQFNWANVDSGRA